MGDIFIIAHINSDSVPFRWQDGYFTDINKATEYANKLTEESDSGSYIVVRVKPFNIEGQK